MFFLEIGFSSIGLGLGFSFGLGLGFSIIGFGFSIIGLGFGFLCLSVEAQTNFFKIIKSYNILANF